jgi:hypothetical protein
VPWGKLCSVADLSDDDRSALALLESALEVYQQSAVLCDLAAIARLGDDTLEQVSALPHDLNFPLGVCLLRS